MGLLSGSLNITRFTVVSRPEVLDFEPLAFRDIAPGSEVRESVGVLPLELEAPYEVGHGRYAFRVRIDRLRPDPTVVRERLKQLVQSEMEMSGASFVGSKKRKQLRELAEEELILQATPSSKIIECCIDGELLYVASTAKSFLGLVAAQLRKIGILVEPKAPWLDGQEEEPAGDLIEAHEPGHSLHGCRFLRDLIGDREVIVEPEAGYARLQTPEARVTLSGAVLKELLRYVQEDAEVLAAKLITGESSFRFEAMSFQLASLRVEIGRHEHWTELLDERLEKIAAVFTLLEEKYAALKPSYRSRQIPVRQPAPVTSSAREPGPNDPKVVPFVRSG